MQIVFFEKPGCANNTRQKLWLREHGISVEAIDLLTYPWSEGELLAFLGTLPVSEWFNHSASRVKSGEVVPEQLSRQAALQLLLQEPLLIRRPLLRKGDERRAGFDGESIISWLGLRAAAGLADLGESCPRPEQPCGQRGEKMMSMMVALENNCAQTCVDAFDYLMAKTQGGKAEYLAVMLASLLAGRGAMPRYLGLPREDFDALLLHHFPDVDPTQFHHYGKPLPPDRGDEIADLRALFIGHIAPDERNGGWHATILLSGCLAENHLWQDMGFRSRADVTCYLNLVFPALAAKNVNDMKWKKFFYKQLCNQEGVYTCRAPSCAVCSDYAKCFGPEE